MGTCPAIRGQKGQRCINSGFSLYLRPLNQGLRPCNTFLFSILLCTVFLLIPVSHETRGKAKLYCWTPTSVLEGSTDQVWICSHFLGWVPIGGRLLTPFSSICAQKTCSCPWGRRGVEGWNPDQLKPSYIFSQHFPSSLPTPNSKLSMVFCPLVLLPGLTQAGLPPTPLPARPHELAQGLTSKDKTFSHMSPHAHAAWTQQPVLG